MELRSITHKIQEVVDICVDYEKFEITVREVAELARLKRKEVAEIMHAKVAAGSLVRLTRGRYRIVAGTRIEQRLPAAFLAVRVFAVLDACRDDLLTYPELKLRLKMGISTDRKSLSVILKRWYRSGCLERTGRVGHYAYRLFPHVTSRPALKD